MSDTILAVVISAAVSGLVAVMVAVINHFTKKSRTPADDNESMRLGNEFLRGLLNDAREEREELRQTIKELRDSDLTKQETIDRLTNLLNSKDTRIGELEERLEFMARKLQSGEHITLADVIGKEPGTVPA